MKVLVSFLMTFVFAVGISFAQTAATADAPKSCQGHAGEAKAAACSGHGEAKAACCAGKGEAKGASAAACSGHGEAKAACCAGKGEAKGASAAACSGKGEAKGASCCAKGAAGSAEAAPVGKVKVSEEAVEAAPVVKTTRRTTFKGDKRASAAPKAESLK